MPLIMLLAVLLTGCIPSIRHAVVDVRASVDQSVADRAYKALTLTLLDKGFDLKMKDS